MTIWQVFKRGKKLGEVECVSMMDAYTLAYKLYGLGVNVIPLMDGG